MKSQFLELVNLFSHYFLNYKNLINFNNFDLDYIYQIFILLVISDKNL